MSWMDSWSRPSKRATVPPPLYLTHGDDVPYCHSCGRVMSSSKKNKRQQAQGVKYCSDRCRQRKIGPTDARIESLIVALLNGEEDSGIEKTGSGSRKIKGDQRNVVTCGEIEEIFFGRSHDPSKVFGRKKNRASRVLESSPEGVDADSTDRLCDTEETEHRAESTKPLIRPPQLYSDVNGSVGGEKGRAERADEKPDHASKRREGQQQADEKEMVRRAARRGVVFGFEIANDKTSGSSKGQNSKSRAKSSIDTESNRRKCEAVMRGAVVEPSFAKGDWAIRWRE